VRSYGLCVRRKEIITGAQSQSCGRSTSSCSSAVSWPHPAIPIQRENGQMRTHKCVFRHSAFHCSAVSWTSVMCDWQWTDSLCRRHGDQPPGLKKKRTIGDLSYQQHYGDKFSMRVMPLDAALPTVFFVSMSLLTSKYLLQLLCIFRYKWQQHGDGANCHRTSCW